MKQTLLIVLLLATGAASLASQPAYGGALYSVHFVPFYPEVQWDGVVSTAADTLTITQWAIPPGSRHWRLTSIPLTLPAVASSGTRFDVPDNWDGSIGNDWAFISTVSNFDLTWLQGQPDPFFQNIFFGWTGSFQNGQFFKSESPGLIAAQTSAGSAESTGVGRLEITRIAVAEPSSLTLAILGTAALFAARRVRRPQARSVAAGPCLL